jgi:hypothetical protein
MASATGRSDGLRAIALRVLLGRTTAGWRLVAGLFVAVLLVPFVSFAGGTFTAPALSLLVPVLLFVAPPAVGAVAGLGQGGLLAAVAAGIAPGVAAAIGSTVASASGILATPDAPALAIAGVFAAVGVPAAVLGYGVGAVWRSIRAGGEETEADDGEPVDAAGSADAAAGAPADADAGGETADEGTDADASEGPRSRAERADTDSDT